MKRLAAAWVIEVLADGDHHLDDTRHEDSQLPMFREWFQITPDGQVVML